MKYLTFFFAIFSQLYFTSCCDSYMEAGANLESEDRCKANITECYNDVFICPGDSVFLCWKGKDGESVEITPGIGIQPLEGCTTVIVEDDVKYVFKLKGGDCPVSDEVRINVIKNGDIIDIQASPPYTGTLKDKNQDGIQDLEDVFWSIHYPTGQVSENIRITSITPECTQFCFAHDPLLPSPFQYASCQNKLCNFQWTLTKINLTGLPAGVSINNATTPLNSFSLAGTWTFTPVIQRTTTINGFANFKLTATCVGGQ